MPPLPSDSLFTRYVFENPWPLAMVLLVVAIVLGWTGFREGIVSRQRGMFIPLILAGIILAIGYLVQTSGENARAVTRRLVDATINKDLPKTDALLANDAVVAFGSPTNPAFDRTFIMERLGRFADTFTIESNSMASLRSWSESSTAATVHLGCFSQVATRSYGSVPAVSQWILKVERQADDQWRITHVTCVSVNNQKQNGNF